MPYVMLPVPAEYEEEFGHWLLGLTLRAKLASWPQGAIDVVVGQADPVSKTILGHIAECTDLWAPAEQIAEASGTDVADLLDRIAALNTYCYGRSWPALIMVQPGDATADGSPAGQSLLMAGPVRSEVLRALEA